MVINQIKKDFAQEIGVKTDITEAIKDMVVVVMYQTGPYGLIKIDDQKVKITSLDIENFICALQDAEDLVPQHYPEEVNPTRLEIIDIKKQKILEGSNQ